MNIQIVPMTMEILQKYHQGFEYDPDVFMDMSRFQPEVCLKHIDWKARHCTLSIHIKNDTVKNRGFGIKAEIKTLHYTFETLGMETVFADAVQKNKRSQHVLQKVGFVETHADETFRYYRCDRCCWKAPKELESM